MTQDHAKSKVFKGSIRMFVIVMRVIRMMVMKTIKYQISNILYSDNHDTTIWLLQQSCRAAVQWPPTP